MTLQVTIIALLLLIGCYYAGKSVGLALLRRSQEEKKQSNDSNKQPDFIKKTQAFSLPTYYAYNSMIWGGICFLTLFIILTLSIFNNTTTATASQNEHLLESVAMLATIATISLAIGFYITKKISFARKHFEKWTRYFLMSCTFFAVSITAIIFFSVLFESLHFFEKVSFTDFLFGLEWSPQTAMRADQAGSSGSFGFIPVFTGTLLITLIAMTVAVPLGIFSAICLSEYSSNRFRNYAKPTLEILAGIPTVVYGFFAAITLGPHLRMIFEYLGVEIASESALTAGAVMGIMIIPYMMSLSDDVMKAVPNSLREASLGLGATKSETIRKVVIPAALPGIMGAFLLAVSRAIGETMIVTMAAGLIAKLTMNPLEAVTTVTVQIVKLLVGDQEFDSAKTLAAFALSLTLFLLTLLLNIAAIMIVKKYREKYE